jgi:hypothetical protein
MNHLPYHVSLVRRDEVLRQAAGRRRANEAAVAAEASPGIPLRRELLKLRPLRLHRSTSQG